jgi:hypothetical protein
MARVPEGDRTAGRADRPSTNQGAQTLERRLDRRLVLITLGVALLAWFFVDQGTGFWHYAKLIGVVPLLTGLVGTCPIYSLLGVSTCPMKSA